MLSFTFTKDSSFCAEETEAKLIKRAEEGRRIRGG